MKKFYVYFTGTTNGRYIEAKTMKQAKEIFAKEEGVILSCYIRASKYHK